MKQDIELHIEELVLHGFSGYDAGRIHDAIVQEIGRLIEERGLHTGLSATMHIGRLQAGSFQVEPGSRAETVGKNIADSLFKPLQHEQSGLPGNGK